MDTQVEVKSKAVELKDRITAHIEELAQLTDSARLSEAMVAYLEMTAKFHQYSPFNVWLILMQKPEATSVAGFHKWKEMGRWVRKGERGIPILAPIFTKTVNEKEEEDILSGFLPVYVFDIQQTDGKPLPEPPKWTSPEKNAEIQQKLIQFATEKEIRVKEQSLPNNTQGVSLGGLILLAPYAGTKTLIHELAHELLHRREDAPNEKALRELEAEAVAYVVGKHFGLEGMTSPNYLALHKVDAHMLMAHLERVRDTSLELINAPQLT